MISRKYTRNILFALFFITAFALFANEGAAAEGASSDQKHPTTTAVTLGAESRAAGVFDNNGNNFDLENVR
ncbi:MAG TPA: hypothetical protein EYN69_07570, partial [Flavobacteriales bacterium]|nr:hypothetical protein [Flavobacteriales bacterium]